MGKAPPGWNDDPSRQRRTGRQVTSLPYAPRCTGGSRSNPPGEADELWEVRPAHPAQGGRAVLRDPKVARHGAKTVWDGSLFLV